MRKPCILAALLLIILKASAQELYVSAEPASNIPAHAVSLKLADRFVTSDNIYSRVSHRMAPQIMYGISKKLMVRAGATIANMHTTDFRYESFGVYVKYRFLSSDELHRHFRMAVFAEASKTKAPFHYDEITLMGDKSGVQAGIIATQLWHKFALSATLAHTQVLDRSRNNKVLYIPRRNYEAMNYSLSAGYLLFPKEYKDYKQTNLNLYVELLGEQLPGRKKAYLDIAPAVQLIFSSNFKVNLGYRVQAAGNMQRMANSSWQLSIERTLLNAFAKKN